MKKPNKQHLPHAASLKRIAKALRVRARNHIKASRGAFKLGVMLLVESELARADIYRGIAEEFDREADLIRAMR